MAIFVVQSCKLYEKKTEKLAVFEKLTFSPEILKPYQLYQNINFSDSDAISINNSRSLDLYQNINFSDSDAISINNSRSLDCATVADGYVTNNQ